MILPITAYGSTVLKQVAEEIDKDYDGLNQLIADMFETMYAAEGVGLAAPQVNKSIRLFVIDASPFADKFPELLEFKKVFINPYIVEYAGKEEVVDEGCLSIPNVREYVPRKTEILIEYYDENWVFHEEQYSGTAARIIQHEYDHIEGVLFVERINNLRKAIIRRKLHEITKGEVDVDYKMMFPVQKRKKW